MAPVDDLLNRLALESLDESRFRGHTPDDGRHRVFGGLVAAQALMAAGKTVSAILPHSLHSYFLRPGDPRRPIDYVVERIRDGASFATRRVVAMQDEDAIFSMSVSFHAEEPGDSHQVPMPEAPPPESVERARDRLARYAEQTGNPLFHFLLHVERPMEHRDVEPVDLLEPEKHEGLHRIWFRADGPVGDDPLLHRCVLTYATDVGLLDNCINVHGYSWLSPELMIASLDHSVWFHRPLRADEWLLHAMDCPSTEGARGLNHGKIFAADGTLVASVAQESLMRRKKPSKR